MKSGEDAVADGKGTDRGFCRERRELLNGSTTAEIDQRQRHSVPGLALDVVVVYRSTTAERQGGELIETAGSDPYLPRHKT